jgi:hypothetical protein
MKLIPKHRRHRYKPPPIAISETEIAADLLYPAGNRRSQAAAPRRTAAAR